MKTNYILIDYENVQPKNLAVLDGHPFKVIVFVGASQVKIPFDLAASLQRLGSNAEYIKISGNGPNALDFHIAFYIGQLAERDSNSYFHIISKDTGFDPLIKHLKAKKIAVKRERDLSAIPSLEITNATTGDEKINAIIKRFTSMGQSRPRKVKTLANTINSLFMKKLNKTEVDSLIKELSRRKCIVIEKDNVSYRPPISQPAK